MTGKNADVLKAALETLDSYTPEAKEELEKGLAAIIGKYRDILLQAAEQNEVIRRLDGDAAAKRAKDRLDHIARLYDEIDHEGQEVTLKDLLETVVYRVPDIEDVNSMAKDTKADYFELKDKAGIEAVNATVKEIYSGMDGTAKASEDGTEDELKVLNRPVKEVYLTRDKINNKIWENYNIVPDTQIPIKMESEDDAKKGITLTAYYLINWDELHDIDAVKTLTSYDRFIHDILGTVYKKGYNAISINQIHRAMGKKENPAPNQAERIKQSLRKMGCAHIKFDNKEEAERYKKYLYWEYEGQLLNIEMITGYDGGQETTLVHIMREPVLMEFASSRKHCITLPVKLLQSPINQTERQLAIQNYLIQRIDKMRNKKGTPPTIILDTLYKNLEITGRKARYDTRKTIRGLLDFYKNCNSQEGTSKCYIKGYTMDNERIKITI